MDDIVTRLRQFGDSNGLDTEAADEIERLRTALQSAANLLAIYLPEHPMEILDYLMKGYQQWMTRTL